MQLVKIETSISNMCEIRVLMLDLVTDTGTHISKHTSTVILFLFRKSIYKGTHNFIHFNLSISLMIGLIIFISGVETARDIKVMLLLYYKSCQNVSLSRLVVQQLQFFCIISSWLHLCGCCVKAYLSSFILIIYFTLDFLLRNIFILDLVGVSCSHETSCITYYIINFICIFTYVGLPVPIVAIAAGIANKHYGSDNGLAHVLNSDTTNTYMYANYLWFIE